MSYVTHVAIIAIVLSVPGFLPLFIWLLRWTLRRRPTQRATPPQVDRCRCGYEMTGLEMARCPECGRVRGFEASAEELGLTDEQLLRIEQKRKSREEKPRED